MADDGAASYSTVFTFAQRSEGSRGGVLVTLTHVDLSVFAATGETDAREPITVALDPQDCTEALSGIVRDGRGVFRVVAEASGARASCLHLQVCESAFLAAIRLGPVAAEEHVINLARIVWREARVPPGAQHDAAIRLPTADVDLAAAWNREFPLFEHQRRTLRWMLETESALPRSLTYAGNLHVAGEFYVDTENECLTDEPSAREASVLGGVCADATGTGKTATLLSLVAASPPVPPAAVPYATGATLVIVPLNLVSQWQREIQKFLLPGAVTVLAFLQGREMRGITMEDVCRADIVITTFHFLRTSKVYSDLVDAALRGKPRTRPVLSSWAREHGHVEPVLEAVTWRRVVVDELHDTFESPRDLQHLRLLQSRARWGLTATPVLDTEQAQHLYFLLAREKSHHPNLLAALIRESVRTHSTPTAHAQPQLRRVRISAEERTRQLLHSEDAEGVVRLSALDDSAVRARAARREGLVVRLEALERSLRILAAATPELEACLERCLAAQQQEDTAERRARTGHAQRALEAHARDLSAAQSMCDAHRHKMERIDAVEATVQLRLRALRTPECPLCARRVSNTLLACCSRAVCDECVRGSDTCTLCGREIGERGRIAVSDLHGVGTKMTKISELIASIGEPVVLFVQWKSMVRGARSFLRSTGLDVLTMEGNVNQRAHTLAGFERGGVLLLCLEESFAGLHLPHSRHVVFAHAIVGDRRLVEAMERQAIARCARHGQTGEVSVFSFVVTDSEEEQLWFRTHDASTAVAP